MVSLDKENSFELREHIGRKILNSAGSDPFKCCFLQFLGLSDTLTNPIEFDSLSLYQKCTISGLQIHNQSVSESDLSRLLGQASRIDSTPMPWVSDLIGVMSIKWLVDKEYDDNVKEQFNSWTAGFIPKQVENRNLSEFESDIALYIRDSSSSVFSTATIPLFLHYHGICTLAEQRTRQELIAKFMVEFRQYATDDTPLLTLALMAKCFDQVSIDLALVPPNGWSLNDLVAFLERIPVGLKRWTWEKEKGRTRNSSPVKWHIEDEYHVQNLLYVLLGPIFDDIADEIYLQQVGQKNPRADLYLPSMHTLIEVKHRKDTKKSFSMLIGEIGEDASLYHADTKYKDIRLICFLWDHTRSTQEHTKFKEGVLKIKGIDACVVVNSPSFMQGPAV